jgi:hypothetical protein
MHWLSWKLANTILVGTLWTAILILGFVDCQPSNASVAEGGAAHYFVWLVVGIFVAIGSTRLTWRRIAWPQKLLTLCAIVTIIDVMAFDLVGNCMFHLTEARARTSGSYIPLSAIAFMQMLAMPASLVALVASFVGRE